MQGLLDRKMKLALAGAASVAAVAGIAPAAALAANTYVDQQTGNDANPCTSAAAPCQSVAGVVGGVAKAGTNDTIFVDGGTYNGTVELGDGKSLIAQEFAGAAEPMPVIDGQTGEGIDVISNAGTISGFVLRGDAVVLGTSFSVALSENVIDEPTVNNATNASVAFIGDETYEVTNNTFTDSPTAGDNHTAVYAETSGSLKVTGNEFSRYRQAIEAYYGTHDIENNLITGSHMTTIPNFPDPPSIVGGYGIVSSEAAATITANRIQQPGIGPARGIYVFDPPGGASGSLNSTRNQVYNFSEGIVVQELDGTVALNGDISANNTGSGIVGALLTSSLFATNVTAYDNGPAGSDISMGDSNLSLNSSIVEDPIQTSGTVTCSIEFSRGPAMGVGCSDFDTTADPAFINPLANNYHLTNGSPMVDAGSNVSPPPGTLDIDGQSRELDGNCDGIARRDIGADELPCPPPAPPAALPAPAATPPPVARKKCKKGRKLRRGRCVRKKKKK